MVHRILTLLLFISLVPAASGAGTEISIRFGDIEGLARERSPLAHMLLRDLDHAEASRRAALQWSNPELSWELERIDSGTISEKEYVLLIEKEFTMPWVASAERSGWNLRLEAARQTYASGRWQLLARLRRGYALLKIHQMKGDFLERFEALVERASAISAEQRREGAISGMEQDLIEMSMLGIHREIQENRDSYRDHMAGWKTEMGIPQGYDVNLEGDGLLSETGLELDLTGIEEMRETSDLAGRRLRAEALEKEIGARKGAIIPSFTIGGGYKNVDDGLDGFVIGVSIPLPLLSRNTGDVEMARAEHSRELLELDLYRTARERRIGRLAESTLERSLLLERYHEEMKDIESKIEALVVSYGEGWIDLAGLLEGLEVYSRGIEDYSSLLEEYFAGVFELEELLERDMLSADVMEREDF